MTREGAAQPVLEALRVGKVAANQRRTVVLAAALIAASLIIGVSNGYWQLGVFVSVGIGLGLLNSLLTELSRKQFAMSALVRLLSISLVAFALAVFFWPDGATVLAGLAVFHLITVAFTGLPLLRELRKA